MRKISVQKEITNFLPRVVSGSTGNLYKFRFLIILFILGFVLRTLFLPSHLFFNYEQGRDFLVVKDIVENHKLTLIGPKTDIGGIFHGPLYYYLLTIPFVVGNGNPVIVSFFLIFLSSFSIPLIYFLTRELSNEKSAKIAAILYSFSFGGIIYPRWLANPPLAIPFIILLFLAIVKIIKGSKRHILILAISLGFIIHLEVVSFILLLPLIISLPFLYRNLKNTMLDLRLIFFSCALFFLIISPYLFFDLRHNLLISKGILELLKGSGGSWGVSFDRPLKLTIDEFSFWVFPFVPKILAAITFLLTLIIARNKILFAWIISVFFMLTLFSKFSLQHFLLTVGPAFVILTAIGVEKVWNRKTVLGISLLSGLVLLNAFTTSVKLPENEGAFFQSGQRQFYFKSQVETIDYIYSSQKGKDFSIHPYTIPYFKNEGWDYLFNWYGKRKYGYLPLEVGAKSFYIIAQPDEGQPWFYNDWIKKESIGNKLIETKHFGIITVEKREVNEK